MSDASQPIDQIIAIRANDPKLMKEGQETQIATNDAFTNEKFFRQSEVSRRQPSI